MKQLKLRSPWSAEGRGGQAHPTIGYSRLAARDVGRTAVVFGKPLCPPLQGIEIDVGGRFELALVPTHPKLQKCEVVWRRDHSFGVKFLPAGAWPASREPVPEAPAEQVVQAVDS